MSVSSSTTMSRPLSADDWLRTFEVEHLDSFVAQGGSTVRFISGGDATLSAAKQGVLTAARARGFHGVELDADQMTSEQKNPDFHKIENFLFGITRTIDWSGEAKRQFIAGLEERGVQFPPGIAANDYEALATANGREPAELLNEYKRFVSDHIIKDRKLARDFRVAIAALGKAQLIPEEMTPTTEEVLLGWLKGVNLPGSMSALKRISIQEKINKTNAKFVLISLCNWLSSARKPGLVVVYDFRAYERIKRSRSQLLAEQNDRMREAIMSGTSEERLKQLAGSLEEAEGPFYSQAAYMKSLELLRHLIDGVEQLPGLALVVLATPRFFADGAAYGRERRFTDYNALQTRIGLEVHDAERQNPSAALVHLETK